MKKNISKEVTLFPPGSIQYRWDEYCDMCGKLIHNTDLQTTQIPDTNEKDYCPKCYRILIRKKRLEAV